MQPDPKIEREIGLPPWLTAFQGLEECESTGIGQDWMIDGVHLWPIVKSVTIGAMMHAGLDKTLRTAPSRSYLNTGKRFRLQRLAPASWRTRTSAGKFAEAIVADPMSERPLWCFGNASPMIEGPLGYAHVHFDPYRLEARRAGLEHWTLFYNERPDDPRLTGALLGPNRSIAADLAALDAAEWQREVRNWRAQIGTLFAGMKGLPIEPGRLADLCQASIAKTLVTRDAFRRVFEHRRPALILCFNYYQRFGWGLIAAAREAGIRVIDIQHGAQGRFHHAYHWACMPGSGWNVVPQEFMLYGLPAGETPSSGRCHVSAPSWYLWCSLAAGGDKLPDRWKQNASLLLDDARAMWSEARKRTVPLYVYASYAEEAPGQIERIGSALGEKGRILTKRHPAAVRDVPAPFERLPLPYTMASVDGLITGYSATILEAAMIGTPCFTMSSNAALMYGGLEFTPLPQGASEAASILAAGHLQTLKPDDRLAAALERARFPGNWI